MVLSGLAADEFRLVFPVLDDGVDSRSSPLTSGNGEEAVTLTLFVQRSTFGEAAGLGISAGEGGHY